MHKPILAETKSRQTELCLFLAIDVVRIVILSIMASATTSVCTVTVYLHIVMPPSTAAVIH